MRGLDITCGCFGHASKNLSFTWHLLLDFVILGGIFSLWFGNRSSKEGGLAGSSGSETAAP
jgi:hypothetical protein